MYFTNEALTQLAVGYEAIDGKYEDLSLRYLTREYVSERGKEFGQHGFARRLQSLKRCIANVYTLLPPERQESPDSEVRHNVELQIQAFIFNAFGAADNLAWVWVSEKNITKNDGTPLPDGSIGIRKEKVRASFTAEFQAHLQNYQPWFKYLEEFRHALAHRIPLYIPPYVVTYANEVAYREIETRKADAVYCKDFAERERLTIEQRQLTVFRPWMQHSFFEEARPVVFHSQLLADYNTIDELGRMLLDELDR